MRETAPLKRNKNMKKWVSRTLITLLAIATLAGITLVAGTSLADHKMNRTVNVPVKAVAASSDAQTVERGSYLFNSRGCMECHGANGAGRMFINDGDMRVAGPNISPGPGNVVSAYSDEDWIRTIRHGVNPKGRPLLIMPSEDFNRFTDADLTALIAHIKSLPPVSGSGRVVELPVPVRMLYGFGMIKDAAAKIDHTLPPQLPVPDGITATHGAYVANMCIGCHGAKLSGGKIPGGPPDWPPAADLTPGKDSAMLRYADADALVKMFKTGVRPDGSPIKVMPFETLREMNETDVRALHLYLKGLPPQSKG
jgi:mono/diheme cytochrome c family protein